jgi:ABC-type polar amino acid transport system ATPase subunit
VNVLECQGVTKAYGERQVLRGIDLEVGEHEAVVLIGASGSGKSTLLRCVDLLDEIDDGDVLLDGEVDRLSGGQQQRVAIVRALATQPRALLLDEITSALDPELVGEVLDLVRELKGEGMTMLIATHEMGFAREVADQVCFLHDGALIERGTPEHMFSAPERPETQRFLRRLLDAGRL